MSFKDHFSGHADDYARFRPGYPRALFQWLAKMAPATEAVWDCGCGNGQASRQLAQFYRQVYATDASAQQIASAHGPANVEYRTALAERSGLTDASVDSICVAQALHWFDAQRFYTEAQRVARPGAVLAVWCYGSARLTGPGHDILDHFEHHVVGPFWPPERSWIDQRYANVSLPGRCFEAQTFDMQAAWPLDALLGYIGSWSATRRYSAATGVDPLPELRAHLVADWGDSEAERPIRWPLVARASRLNTDQTS